MRKNIDAGELVFTDGMLAYYEPGGLVMAFACEDQEIYNYIQSKREFEREMHYFFVTDAFKRDAKGYKSLFGRSQKLLKQISR